MASRSFGSTLFLSTPSARRATAEQLRQPMGGMISIHALREEGDTGKLYTFLAYEISIHALREEGDTRTRESAGSTKNFYPRPPRGGRRIYIELDGSPKFISIHALREEGDISDTENPIPPRYFYPRPPRGGRPQAIAEDDGEWEFLSTPSARRATSKAQADVDELKISIHALREEGDQDGGDYLLTGKLFLSTPSARRATGDRFLLRHIAGISIHALREEGDGLDGRPLFGDRNFYPRPPRGGRPLTQCFLYGPNLFLSTPSARRATASQQYALALHIISIHALREEGDRGQSCCLRRCRYFYPRPPRGGRRASVQRYHRSLYFYPRPPRGGRLSAVVSCYDLPLQISIHALREEGDIRSCSTRTVMLNFYPRPPRGGRPSR